MTPRSSDTSVLVMYNVESQLHGVPVYTATSRKFRWKIRAHAMSHPFFKIIFMVLPFTFPIWPKLCFSSFREQKVAKPWLPSPTSPFEFGASIGQPMTIEDSGAASWGFLISGFFPLTALPGTYGTTYSVVPVCVNHTIKCPKIYTVFAENSLFPTFYEGSP